MHSEIHKMRLNNRKVQRETKKPHFTKNAVFVNNNRTDNQRERESGWISIYTRIL